MKQKSSSLPRNVALRTWQIANSVLSKGKSTIPPQFNSPEVLCASDKAKLFAKNLSENSHLDDSGISLPVFPSWTNLKLPRWLKRS